MWSGGIKRRVLRDKRQEVVCLIVMIHHSVCHDDVGGGWLGGCDQIANVGYICQHCELGIF